MVGFSREAHLCYKDFHSDKVYHISLEQASGSMFLWRVMVKFGPRLGTLTHVDLTKGSVGYSEASALYEKRLAEKLAKGYQPINDDRAKLIDRIAADESLPYFTQTTKEKLADFILAYVEGRA